MINFTILIFVFLLDCIVFSFENLKVVNLLNFCTCSHINETHLKTFFLQKAEY